MPKMATEVLEVLVGAAILVPVLWLYWMAFWKPR
jgi:hypothetical protein